MDSSLFGVWLTLSADGVIPTIQRSTSNIPLQQPKLSATRARGSDSFLVDPNNVDTMQAAGGFNSVIEVSARYCLRVFDMDLNLPDFEIGITPDEMRELLVSRKASLQSAYLKTLAIPESFNGIYVLRCSFSAISLTFSKPHRVCVTYATQVTLAAEDRPPPKTPLHHVETLQYQVPRGTSFLLRAPYNMVSPGAEGKASAVPGAASTGNLQGEASSDQAPGGQTQNFLQSSGLVPHNSLGSFDLEICTDYLWETDDILKRVYVYADLSRATVTRVHPSGDAVTVLEYLVPDGIPLTSQRHGLNAKRVYIAPVLSLVGRSPSNSAVTELPDFNVEVFHLGPSGHQALATAFNLTPASIGLVEEVQQFIGDYDYGVISDEYMIERVFLNKWRMGGFTRLFPVSAPVQVKKDDGTIEDIVAYGAFSLDALSWVRIDPHANTRSDLLKLGGDPGTASLTILSVKLRNGTVLGPDKVDFGPPKKYPWSVYTIATSTTPALSNDDAVRGFQIRAHEDAYQHIAKPFAFFPIKDPLAIEMPRLDGIARTFYVIGNIPTTFI